MAEFDHLGALLACKEEDGFCWSHIRPSSLVALTELLDQAAREGWHIVPGSPRTIPGRLRGKQLIFVDLSNLAAVLEHRHEDQVITVESGITLRDLDKILAPHKQWWPVYALNPATTVGDLVNLGEGGCLEHGFGGPRDLVLGLSAALSSGDVISCGGKVVKNVTGYDLQKLFIGSRGWLGIVCKAHLRLFARPESSRSVVGFATTAGYAFTAVRELLGSGLPLSCLELVDSATLRLLAESQAGAELKSLSGLSVPSGKQAPYAVLIQIHGQATVLEETIKEIRGRLRSTFGGLPDIGSSRAAVLWSLLSDVPSACGMSALELAGSPSQMLALLQSWWQQVGSPAWQCRPGRGRMKFFAKNRESLQALVESLGRWTAETGQTLVVARSDSEYEWRVDRLPLEDEKSASLKGEIKMRYDPSGCLNPLAAM